MESSQYLLECTNLSVPMLQTLNLIRGASGLLCMLTAILVFAILLRLYWITPKLQRSVMKRMVLILTAATIPLQVLLALQFEHYFQYTGQPQVCAMIGFLNQWLSSIEYNYALGITIYLMYVVCRVLSKQVVMVSSRLKTILETLFYVVILFFPLLYMWVPFTNSGYGLDMTFCWIVSSDKNCSLLGALNRDMFFGVSVVEGVISIGCIFIVSLMYCVVCGYKKLANKKIVTLLRRTLFLMCLLITRLAIAILGTLIRIPLPTQLFVRWMYLAAFVPISYMIVPLGFLVYACAIGKSKKRCSNFCKKRDLFVMPVDQLSAATNNQSKKEYVRSYTHWSVPYTNGFNSNSDPEELEWTLAELQPFRSSCPDTGYSSLHNSDQS